MALINKTVNMAHKLLCQNCNKVITSKIISCENGDNICFDCYKKDKICNYCQNKTLFINYSLINIMNDINLKIFVCGYEGCNKLLTYNEAQEHVDSCSFNLITYNQLFSSELSSKKDYILNCISDLSKVKNITNNININFIIDKNEYIDIVEYTFTILNEYNKSNIKIKSNNNYTININKENDTKINITIQELDMDINDEYLYERIDYYTPFLIVFYMVKDDIIMLTDDFHLDYDNFDISYCSLNTKQSVIDKQIPYVIKYIYEDTINLLKISKYKQNENYILSLKNLLESYDTFILNTNSIKHNSTNKFIIGLKQFKFNNYTLKDINNI